jgi:hypothetical protein
MEEKATLRQSDEAERNRPSVTACSVRIAVLSGWPVNWNLGAKYHEEGNRRREHGTANPQNLADHL